MGSECQDPAKDQRHRIPGGISVKILEWDQCIKNLVRICESQVGSASGSLRGMSVSKSLLGSALKRPK